MPNFYSRLNLASAIFPFYTEAAGRTIMVPQLDENWDRYNAANTTPDKGVPQVFYMHNVLPIAGGFQSIGYDTQITGITGANLFDHAYTIRNSDLGNFIFVPANGTNYIYDAEVGNWNSVSPFTPNAVPEGVLVTTAYVQGQSYIYYANYGCFVYDDVNKVLVPVTLTGLNEANILGICSANGYLIAWSTTSVFWSSITQPTIFTPSIQTGAGSVSLQDAKGGINVCLPIGGGFIAYCEKNAVGATYTSNTSYPYIFAEIPNSGGCSDPNKVGWQSNLDNHVALTTSGMQSLTKSTCQPVMPEVSDFLAAQLFEDFDEVALSFTSTYCPNQLNVKIAAISDRFIVISYGQTLPDYTHALVYDTVLNRYGKLKIAHRSCFDYNNPSPYGFITYAQLQNILISSFSGTTTYENFFTNFLVPSLPKKTLAFLQKDGTVSTVDFTIAENNADGVFIIGKFQMQRNDVFVHQRTDVETINNSSTFNFYLLPTFDGKDFTAAVPTITNKEGTLTRTFAKRYTASNISFILIGAFNVTSIVINFTVGGSR